MRDLNKLFRMKISKEMKKIIVVFSLIFIILVGIFYFLNPFKPAGDSSNKQIIMINSTSPDAAAIKLEDAKLIRSFTAFNILYGFKGNRKIEEGGYYLSEDMNAFEIIEKLNSGPDLKSITIPEGIRKEQIGERLQKLLGWNNEQLEEWNNVYSENNTDYKEGVYFPDTYLIPVSETPTQISNRIINNFNKKFIPYLEEATGKNIKWTTVLKIASLIEREAAGPSDMKLISGVIWNRLENGQKLQIDAAIQYAKGKTDGQWWSRVSGSDIRNIDSPYNNYKYSGLPPTPIANPGIAAINAAINPEETDCFFYLHDKSRQIHCSVTYEEHLKNIKRYLN